MIFCLTFVGSMLGVVGFFYQKRAINELVIEEQPVDTKDKENKSLLKQNLFGAGLILFGSTLLLFALILSEFPKWFK